MNGKSFVTFKNPPKGSYAVTVLHDENSNEEIDKTFFYPKEGFGLTNFEKISLSNHPNFSKASFVLSEDAVKKLSLFINEDKGPDRNFPVPKYNIICSGYSFISRF